MGLFLTIPLQVAETPMSIMCLRSFALQINDKVIYMATTSFIGCKSSTRFILERRWLSCGLLGIK